MSKPRLFIGSSVEGLSIAYAIQENLKFTSENTVWSQGVFNLSESTLESLLALLDTCDFGVFVFTPDDHIKIRGKKDLAIRDNVLFELGLFIGRLGRERCFIVTPDNKVFHLPTDLIGLTPAKYETTRSDGNLQAATGSASNKIRESIVKLGISNLSKVEPEKESSELTEIVNKNSNEDWFEQLFVVKDYDIAIKALKKKIRNEKDNDNKIILKGYICYSEFQKDALVGKAGHEKLIEDNKQNNVSYLSYANTLFSCNSFTKAIEVIDEGLKNCSRKINLTLLKADCLWETNRQEESIKLLNQSILQLKDPLFYLKVASRYDFLEQKKSALEILYKGFIEYPNNENILYQLARISYDLGHKDVCILIYKQLLSLNDNNSNYWCLLGNAYLDLEFDNFALTAYEKASEKSANKENWILSNIGNLYNNKKLYDKAEFYLTTAQKYYEKSDYTLNRLSSVFLNKQEESKRLEKILKDAKAKLSGTILTL